MLKKFRQVGCAGILLTLYVPLASGGVSDFGTTGLIKLPNARMAEDGTLRATIALDDVANIYNITYQALPKIQGTFRYSIFNPNQVTGSGDKMRDRSYEIKTSVMSESAFLPAVAIGVRDILGTGVWQGEYLVASKKAGDFDLTVGLGWGRLGERSSFSNPLGVISSRFDERPSGRIGGDFGGESRGNSFFRGDAAIFGGVVYRFPKLPISAILEYESDQYNREVGFGTLEDPSPLNVALVWRPIKDTSLRLSWLRGDTLGITFSSQVNTKTVGPRKFTKRKRPPLNTQSGLPDGYSPNSWYDQMLYEAEHSGLYLRKGNLKPDSTKATIVIENRSYNLTADAINQAALLSELYMPSRVSSVDILLKEEGLAGPTINYSLQRASFSEKTSRQGAAGQVAADGLVKILAPRRMSASTSATDYGYPSLGFGFDLAAKVQLMDPDDPARKQIFAKLTGRLQLSDHFNIWMRYEQNLLNDFTTRRGSNSVLPKVRTLVNDYLVKGESGIEQFYGEYRKSLSASVHSRLYAGILESMYGGIGGEFLYAPYRQRWALGLNVNAVKQREFERNFKFRDYQTITMHISAYYASPFYDIDMAVHLGRYLAEDRGYTFEARRTFDSGFSLGGFFTRTNVSAEEFGEGSFDKGLFFRIPFDGLFPGNTRAAYSTILRPLERDGGRRLEGFGGTMWFDRRAMRFDALDRNRARMVP